MAGDAEKITFEPYILIALNKRSDKGRFVRPFFYAARAMRLLLRADA